MAIGLAGSSSGPGPPPTAKDDDDVGSPTVLALSRAIDDWEIDTSLESLSPPLENGDRPPASFEGRRRTVLPPRSGVVGDSLASWSGRGDPTEERSMLGAWAHSNPPWIDRYRTPSRSKILTKSFRITVGDLVLVVATEKSPCSRVKVNNESHPKVKKVQ
jgi:hypothetical protein